MESALLQILVLIVLSDFLQLAFLLLKPNLVAVNHSGVLVEFVVVVRVVRQQLRLERAIDVVFSLLVKILLQDLLDFSLFLVLQRNS